MLKLHTVTLVQQDYQEENKTTGPSQRHQKDYSPTQIYHHMHKDDMVSEFIRKKSL